jgi:hypothetical protein
VRAGAPHGEVHTQTPDLLTDVATTSSQAADASQTPERHKAAAAIVQRILDGTNGVRHSRRRSPSKLTNAR